MPEVAAGLHIRRPGQPGVTSAWAEEFFHSQAEAFDTIKRRLRESIPRAACIRLLLQEDSRVCGVRGSVMTHLAILNRSGANAVAG